MPKKDSLSDTKKLGFETSLPFKRLFNESFELWSRATRSDLKDLAEKLGVTSAYLSQVRRYGRIPSKPVLILMSLLFKRSGDEFFHACGIGGPFPFDKGLQITLPSSEEESVLSLKFNTQLLSDTIKNIVRNELRTRNVKDILSGKTIRIGLNHHFYWLFDSNRNSDSEGDLAELCRMIGMTLQKEVEFIPVTFAEYLDKLSTGVIDLFGPVMVTPDLPIDVKFTSPLYHLCVAGLYRKKKISELPALPTPKTIDDLRTKPYKIAVVKNSLSHILATTLLKKQESDLVFCSSHEEAVERTMLREIPRPVHIAILNGAAAALSAKEYSKDLELVFGTRDNTLDLADIAFAVRPDWPEVVPVLNDALRFLKKRGGFTERLKNAHKGKLAELAVFDE